MQTAQECCNKLKVCYAQLNYVRLIFQLQQELSCITQDNDSISEFFTKLSSLWEELSDYMPLSTCSCKKCACKVFVKLEKAQDTNKICKLLMGLNDSCDMIRGQIMIMDPKPSLDKDYSLVLQEERQKEARNAVPMVESLVINVEFKRQKEKLHGPKCPNMSNHTVDTCFKHGYPTNYPKKPFYGRGGCRGCGGSRKSSNQS